MDTVARAIGECNARTGQVVQSCPTFKDFLEKVEYVGTRYGGEFGDDPLYEFTIDGETVEVGYNSEEKFWYVIWNGALDYEGNLSGLKKRYPELRKTGRF